ncbi:hypothetical protein EV589_2122 [Mycobacterium sp. BK558]|nr:hypothetical protein EV589_2122 [Mycobacterium sp. BK558]
MALGNGAGGPPAGVAIRTPGSPDVSLTAPDSSVHAKYKLDNARQVVTLELSYDGATSTYSVPQQLFKDKFLPKAIADGSLSPDDKQVGQVNDFDWRWQLFTNTLTIQKPTAPDGSRITLDQLAQYFPQATSYNDIRAKVQAYPGFNNSAAFENTLLCAKGFEMYGTIIDGKLFTDLGEYSTWVETQGGRTDPRYSYWRCIEAIARSREKTVRQRVRRRAPRNSPGTSAVGTWTGRCPRSATRTTRRRRRSSPPSGKGEGWAATPGGLVQARARSMATGTGLFTMSRTGE